MFFGSRLLASGRSLGAAPRRVACLGDSLTASGIYCSALKGYLPPCRHTKACGDPGAGTREIRNHVDEALAWGPTDLVVMAALNDLPNDGEAAIVITNLKKIYDAAQIRGVRVIAVQLTPWLCYKKANAAATWTVNDWIQNESSVDEVVSTWTLADAEYCLLRSYDAGDGLHLNRTGQETLAMLIADQAFH